MASASRFYPLSQARQPPPTTFVDAIDIVFDSTIPYDLRFFQALDRFVQREPWLERDKAMIDMLKIDRHREGKDIQAGRQDAEGSSNEAAREAHAWLDLKYEGIFVAAVQRGHALGAAGLAGRRRRHA